MTPGPSASGPTRAASWSFAVAFVGSLTLPGLGRKKEIDPAAFDAGVTTAASAPSASAAEPTAADPTATDVAPLAPLSSTSTPTKVAAAAAKPGTTDAKAGAAKSAAPGAAPIAECAKAKQFCEHPAAKTDTAIQGLCTKYKDECTKKGGHP